MICDVRNGGHEVVLRDVTFSDLLALIYLWLHKDKEIAFQKPEEERLFGEEGDGK